MPEPKERFQDFKPTYAVVPKTEFLSKTGGHLIVPDKNPVINRDEMPDQYWKYSHDEVPAMLPSHVSAAAEIRLAQRQALRLSWLGMAPAIMHRLLVDDGISRVTRKFNVPKGSLQCRGKGNTIFAEEASRFEWSKTPQAQDLVSRYKRIADMYQYDVDAIPLLWGKSLSFQAPAEYLKAEMPPWPRPFLLTALQETTIDVAIRHMLYSHKVVLACLYANYHYEPSTYGPKSAKAPKAQVHFAEVTLAAPWKR